MQHEMLTQVGRGLVNLYYCLRKRKKTDLPQHEKLTREAAASMTPNQTLSVEVQFIPMSYKNPKCQTKSLQVARNILR